MACGSPLEHTREAGGPRRRTEGRTAWYPWLALCLALGAVLGLSLVRVRAPDGATTGSYLLGLVLGALVGAVLGALPGPALTAGRRAWAAAVSAACTWCASRRLARIRRQCEEAIESGSADAEVQLRLAGVFWLQGAPGQAEPFLRRALEAPGDSALARHNFAATQGASGRRARAAEELERARAGMGDSTDLLWNLGLARWGLDRLPGAAEAFHALKQLDATDLAARNGLALALARQGELDQAISELEEALAVGPRSADALCNLGAIQQSRGNLDVASRYFAGALQREPTHVAARYNRGLCAALEGQYHAAIQHLGILLHAHPDHARALAQKAICRHQLGGTRQALDSIRRAARVGRGDFIVLYNAGTLLLREGIVDHAVTELERAYEIQPGNIEVIINLGVAVHLSDRPRQALDHFRAAVRMNPRHVLARYNCAVAYSMTGALEESEREIDQLLALYPDLPEAFNAIGVIRLRQNRLVEAAEQFRRLADIMPQSAIVRSNLALTYYLEGDLAAAAEQAHYAATLDPKLAAAHDLAGHTAIDMNDIPLAIEHFSALAALEPANPTVHTNLGLSYYKDDRLNESIESYERVLIFDPNSPEGHNDLGLSYAKSKMLSESATHLRKVIDWRPDNPVVHSNLGLVCYFNGDTEDAVEQWREVTRLSPAYARSREATRFSAYDDQEMVMRPIDRHGRATHFPLKVAAFRHSFQLALDENAYRIALPWPDLAAAAAWCERARRARSAMAGP